MRRIFLITRATWLLLRLGLLGYIAPKQPGLKRRVYLWGDWFFSYRRHTIWQNLAQKLWRLGPAFVKLGQLLASHPAIIGTDLSQRLACLYERLPPLTPRQFRQLARMCKNLPHPIYLTPQALASGSMAVVYRAHDKAGQDLVVKYLRPGIGGAGQANIEAMRWGYQCAKTCFPALAHLRLEGVFDELSWLIKRESDLRIEAENSRRYSDNHRPDVKTPKIICPEIICPKIIWQASNENILTMTHLTGAPLSEAGDSQLAQRLADLFFTDFFVHGFFHADPHPGNMRVDNTGRIILFDFGIMGILDAPSRRQILKIFTAIHSGNATALIRLHRQGGVLPENLCKKDEARLIKTLKNALNEKTLKKRLNAVLNILETYNLHLTPTWPLVHKTLFTLLGILADIAPNSDPLEYFATAMHRHLGTLSPLLPLLLELDDQADATLIKLVQNLDTQHQDAA